MTHAVPPSAFRVLALVDPGRGGRRIAFLAALGARDCAPVMVPPGSGSVDFVCTGLARRHKRRYRKGLPAEIVPEVLAPGDLVVVRPDSGCGAAPGGDEGLEHSEKKEAGEKGGLRRAARVEALRILPVTRTGRREALA